MKQKVTRHQKFRAQINLESKPSRSSKSSKLNMTNKTHLNHLRSVTCTRCRLLIIPYSSSFPLCPFDQSDTRSNKSQVQIIQRFLRLSNISAPCIPRFFCHISTAKKAASYSWPQQETTHPSPARPSTLHRHPGWVTNTTEADCTTSSSSPYPVRKAPWTAWNGWFLKWKMIGNHHCLVLFNPQKKGIPMNFTFNIFNHP